MKDYKNKKNKKEDFIDVFKYFESANTRNREAFCELLDYTGKVINTGDSKLFKK